MSYGSSLDASRRTQSFQPLEPRAGRGDRAPEDWRMLSSRHRVRLALSNASCRSSGPPPNPLAHVFTDAARSLSGAPASPRDAALRAFDPPEQPARRSGRRSPGPVTTDRSRSILSPRTSSPLARASTSTRRGTLAPRAAGNIEGATLPSGSFDPPAIRCAPALSVSADRAEARRGACRGDRDRDLLHQDRARRRCATRSLGG